MGSSQEYSPTNSNRKPDLFDQAEQAAFRHVVANLCAMPFCSRADLEQAAKSYFWRASTNPVQGTYSGKRTSSARRRRGRRGGIKSTWPAERDGRTPSTRQRKRRAGGAWP